VLTDLCTDADGKCHGTTIAPPLIRPDVIAGIKACARALVAPQVAAIFERDPRPFFQAIFDFDAPRIVFGRVALLGDAAFVARPHPGAGTTKAALDAQKLADSIAAHSLDEGLARYQREQGAFGCGLVALGRREGAYLSDQLKPRAERREQAMNWPIENLMHSHNTRSEALRRVLDESLQMAEATPQGSLPL
jgi:2-polyprenyl-6-methoxyphenol hydroxylase-like FAD-dependent oxidoreductase